MRFQDLLEKFNDFAIRTRSRAQYDFIMRLCESKNINSFTGEKATETYYYSDFGSNTIVNIYNREIYFTDNDAYLKSTLCPIFDFEYVALKQDEIFLK